MKKQNLFLYVVFSLSFVLGGFSHAGIKEQRNGTSSPPSVNINVPKVHQESVKLRSKGEKNWWEKITALIKKSFLEDQNKKIIRIKPQVPPDENNSLSMSWRYFDDSAAEWLAAIGDIRKLAPSPLDLHTIQEINRLREQYGELNQTDLTTQKNLQGEIQSLMIHPQDLNASQIYKHLKECDCKSASLEEFPLDEKVRSHPQYKDLNLQNVFLFYEEGGDLFAAVNFYHKKDEFRMNWRVMSRMSLTTGNEGGKHILRLSAPSPQYALGYYFEGMMQQGWCPQFAPTGEPVSREK